MKKRGFSLYDIEQFIREAGAERITEDAVLDLEKELEKLTEKVANSALRYAQHAGRRKLIRKEDVLLTAYGGGDYSSAANFRAKASTTKNASRSIR